MITATQIYAVTRDGLDIILYYYPQAEECVDDKKYKKNSNAGWTRMMRPPASVSLRSVTR